VVSQAQLRRQAVLAAAAPLAAANTEELEKQERPETTLPPTAAGQACQVVAAWPAAAEVVRRPGLAAQPALRPAIPRAKTAVQTIL
jgi:hypothetical protein